jgi:hypothetical protein
MKIAADDINVGSIILVNSVKVKPIQGLDEENPIQDQVKANLSQAKVNFAGIPIEVDSINLPFIAGFLHLRSNTEVIKSPIIIDYRDYNIEKVTNAGYLKFFGIQVNASPKKELIRLPNKQEVKEQEHKDTNKEKA